MTLPSQTSEYSHLKTLTMPSSVVYPFESRRFGKVIGLNLLGSSQKICSYDCPYCELGTTEIRMNDLKRNKYFLSSDEIIQNIIDTFNTNVESLKDANAIIISGNGEPTLYPYLDEVIPRLLVQRDHFFPKMPVGILTNGSHLDSRKLLLAVDALEIKAIKIDAGNDKTMKIINAPLVKDSVEKIITICRKLKNVVVQSCFVHGVADNTKNEDIEDWIESVGMIKPTEVHIYTLDRVPAVSGLLKTDEDTLYTIAAKLEKRTRIKAKVFY